MLMWTALAVWLFSTASGASSYILVPKLKLWADAEAFCQAKFGTNLATFRTPWDAHRIWVLAKQDLDQGDASPWIGLNDRANEGIWLFSDGTGCPVFNPCTRAVFPPWKDNPNKPSGGIHKNCGVADSHATTSTSMVFDDNCDFVHRHFICNYNPALGNVPPLWMVYIYDEDNEDDEDDEVDPDLVEIVDDPDAQVQKIPCSEAGLTLGIPHECTCIAGTTCPQDSRFCNAYEFVYSKVGGVAAPHELVCADDVWEVCCCSCQNCPDWTPFSV